MKKILCLLVCLWVLTASAQHTPQYLATKDSLLKIIPTLDGKAKLEAYETLAKQLFFHETDVESTLPVFDNWEKEAGKQGDRKLQYRVMYLGLGILINRVRYDAFIERVGAVLAFAEEHDFCDESYYNIQNSRLFALYELGRLSESLSESKALYQKEKERGRPMGMTTALFRMGEVYCNLRRFPEAESCYRECLTLQDNRSSKLKLPVDCYFGLVDILIQQKRCEEALDVLQAWEALLRTHEEAEGEHDDYFWKQFYLMKAYAYNRRKDVEQSVRYLQKADSIPSIYNGMENPSFRSHVRASILSSQKKYAEALPLFDTLLTDKNRMVAASAMEEKAAIFCHTGRGEEALPLFIRSQEIKDSIQHLGFVVQLDELRTQYEVDRHIAEKERNRMYFLFAFGGCCLLAAALGIWVYYSRKVARKNRALVHQIKEMVEQQELHEKEILDKPSLVTGFAADDDDICPETRRDQLCIAIREAILRDKLYLNASITRDDVISRLGTSKSLFIETFQYCFGMSFNEYIANLRMKNALILLERSDLPIEEISEKSGFGTVRTFRRHFGEKYGMSPVEYRKLQTTGKV